MTLKPLPLKNIPLSPFRGSGEGVRYYGKENLPL